MENYARAKKRIFSRVLILSLTAAFIASLIIALANDMYAFIKKDSEVILTVEEPLSLYPLATLLEKNGIIENPFVFTLYVRSKNKTDMLEGFCGEAVLNSSMSYREILSALSS